MGVGHIRHDYLKTRSVLFASGILAQHHPLVNYSTDPHNHVGGTAQIVPQTSARDQPRERRNADGKGH
jgi:hypothetical protein